MKSRERKKEDLKALTEQFNNSTTAMVLSFNKLTVDHDQQFRGELRESGVSYGVVKNTLARLAVKDTPFEDATEHFNGVTSVAWTDQEPVNLSKVIAKYVKEGKGVFEFKTGIVEGRVVDFSEVESIASLPPKEELIGKLLYLLNAPAQRLATVLSAIPRDLAQVVKQVSEREGDVPEAKAEEPADSGKDDAAKSEEAPKAEAAAEEKADSGDEESKSGDEAGSADAKEKPEGDSDKAAVEETPESKDDGDEKPADEKDSE